jgi:hypothetical protein
MLLVVHMVLVEPNMAISPQAEERYSLYTGIPIVGVSICLLIASYYQLPRMSEIECFIIFSLFIGISFIIRATEFLFLFA